MLLAVAGRIGDWRSDGRPASFRRWLTTLARNAAVKTLLRQSRRPEVDAETILESLPAGSDSAAAIQEYRQQALAWALEQIRDEFRPSSWNAFWETAVLGRSIEAACRELGLSSGAVYMARSRIMARLRERTRQFDPDEDETVSICGTTDRQDQR